MFAWAFTAILALIWYKKLIWTLLIFLWDMDCTSQNSRFPLLSARTAENHFPLPALKKTVSEIWILESHVFSFIALTLIKNVLIIWHIWFETTFLLGNVAPGGCLLILWKTDSARVWVGWSSGDAGGHWDVAAGSCQRTHCATAQQNKPQGRTPQQTLHCSLSNLHVFCRCGRQEESSTSLLCLLVQTSFRIFPPLPCYEGPMSQMYSKLVA